MRGVCACVRVYVCTCVEGGREGEKEGEGGRERSVRGVCICVYMCGREGEGERGVTGVCMCVYMCPCMCVHVCGV